MRMRPIQPGSGLPAYRLAAGDAIRGCRWEKKRGLADASKPSQALPQCFHARIIENRLSRNALYCIT